MNSDGTSWEEEITWSYTSSTSSTYIEPLPEPEYDLPPLPSWECIERPVQNLSPGKIRDARPAIWACRPRHGLGG